jgi:hypothetical protein
MATDRGQIDDDGDAESLELVARSDAGKHQQLRRVDRPTAEDHVARLRGVGATLVPELDADGAIAIDHDAHDLGIGTHRQVRAPADRPEEGVRGTRTTASVLGHLAE